MLKSYPLKLLCRSAKQFFYLLCLSFFSQGFVTANGMTADHSQFEQLQQSFNKLEDINTACVSCHNQAEAQLHQTVHWQWTYPLDENTEPSLGKLNVINGYHPSTLTNNSACGSCHIGFGLSSRVLDEIPPAAVDCLMCHDTSGDYAYLKFHQDGAECAMCHDDGAEQAKAKIKQQGETERSSLTDIAQQVGQSSVQSCGSCHFYGGGGDGSKHGDLDSALITASHSMDVHMSSDGAGLVCNDCHQAEQHQLNGSRYRAQSPSDVAAISALEGPRATCVSCHGNAPMHDAKLNDHTDVIACQTCHIPSYARNGVATKTSWDWSTAGKLNRKKRPEVDYDEQERVKYSSYKGSLSWGENLTPHYQWFNGELAFAGQGAQLSLEQKTPLNPIQGAAFDGQSKIFPFHVFQSKLPVDAQSEKFIPISLVGRSRDVFWNGYDWQKALAYADRISKGEFSGEFDFADVEMAWALNHTVAPKEQALQCVDCHRADGRLAQVEGVYIPGAGQHAWLNQIGALALLATLAGVGGHGALRFWFYRRRQKNEH